MTIPAGIDLPSRKAIRDVFSDLIGRDVDIADGERVTPDTAPLTVGSVIYDTGTLAAVFAADLALSVRAGAALGLIPKGGADDYIEDKEIPATLAENFYEVLNVLSSVFNTPGARHVRLGQVWTDPAEIDLLVLGVAKELGRREDVRLTIPGYGDGNLSVVVA